MDNSQKITIDTPNTENNDEDVLFKLKQEVSDCDFLQSHEPMSKCNNFLMKKELSIGTLQIQIMIYILA